MWLLTTCNENTTQEIEFLFLMTRKIYFPVSKQLRIKPSS